ncbi:MAG: acetate--CoA ligase family protein [Candidatus Aenigmarchaeota archaeon]|nr:acetate--CoA ligase family protein [Candidatus Aenigmarchaeota archaeon]
MDLLECLNFLKDNGISIASTKHVRGMPEEFPVVLKANVLEHKSEQNLVRIIHCPGEFGEAWHKMGKTQDILVQERVSGIELILGIHTDETFGKVIMAGAGGIFTQVMMDVSFRAVPLTRQDASEMIKELRIYEVLKGFRGKSYDLSLVEDAILKLSEIAENHPEISSLDINPFIINDRRGVAVDCRIF